MMTRKITESRENRINRLAKLLAIRHEKRVEKQVIDGKRRRPLLKRKDRKRATVKRSIAYDLETTNIAVGTPAPLYITAFNADLGYSLSIPIKDIRHLRDILISRFLDEDLNRCRFVGWNANNFDVYFVCAALLHSPEYILRPYLTKGKKVRGVKVLLKSNEKIYWEFLDGMAMTGIQKPLKDFLKVFAPDYQKLESPNFEHETFDAKNPDHCAYALRDSEGLYYGLKAAEAITVEHFKLGLQPTIGNLGIKCFQSRVPTDVQIVTPSLEVVELIRHHVMRGGYCYCVRKYHGPVWKYDINQAYAAAMREADLPSGRCIETKGKSKYARCAIYKVNARNPRNTVPFYWRDIDGRARFDLDNLENAWLTSVETRQLEAEGWRVEYLAGHFWQSHFRMKEYVDMLEDLRVNGPGGPKSAQGEMVKAVGNNSYGKTVEQLDGLEIVMAPECPEGFAAYQDDDAMFPHLWFRFADPSVRDYHQPQLGAFITAQVRMVLRRAILLDPEAWLYADTDGVMFSRAVPLDIDPKRYGAWKEEAAGEVYRLITKKVYANDDASERHAKGLNIKRLTNDDFIRWFDGVSPEQTQIQRNNMLSVMSGGEMYREVKKVGQRL